MSLLKLAKIDTGVTQSQIGEIVFFRRFDVGFSLDVIPLRRLNQERVFEVAQILSDGVRGNSRFFGSPKGVFQFFWVGQRSNGRRQNIEQILQFSNIFHPVMFADVPQIDLTEKVL